MTSAGYAKHPHSATAASLCLDRMGCADPVVILVFAGGLHAPASVLAAVRSRHPSAVVVGGSAAGAIARDGFGYSGQEIAMIGFPADIAPRVIAEHGLREGERAAGERLGRRIRDVCSAGAAAMIFYDCVASESPLRIHPAAPLVRGINDGLGGTQVTLVGGAMLTDLDLTNGWIFDGERAVKHAAVALVFPPFIEVLTTILHGCVPVSSPIEITKIDQAEVLQIENRPALDVVEELLGIPVGTSDGHDLTMVATLGERHGDPFASYDENNYVNRLILGVDRNKRSVTLFEPDFVEGSLVQIMSRDNGLMFSSVVRGVEWVNRAVANHSCVLGLYVDCAGRASVRTGCAVEEASLVARDLAPHVPFIGFYSGVEIAPVAGGDSRGLDWTGVVAVLLRRNDPS